MSLTRADIRGKKLPGVRIDAGCVPNLLIVGTKGEQFAVDIVFTPTGQSAPWRAIVVTNAYLSRAAFHSSKCSPHFEVMVSDVVFDVSWVFCQQRALG